MGIRFSDSSTPFPDYLRTQHIGSWSHVVSTGWLATTTTDERGPGMTIPIVRPGNWYAEARFTIGGAITTNSRVEVGALTATNHVVGYGESRNPGTLSHQAYAYLFSNDGDDTFTQRFSGSPLNNPGYVILRFRCQDGCIGVYDDEDNVWEWYEGRNATGVSYTPAYAFFQVQKVSGVAMATIHITELKIVYTL
jgi:hypothetical protein